MKSLSQRLSPWRNLLASTAEYISGRSGFRWDTTHRLNRDTLENCSLCCPSELGVSWHVVLGHRVLLSITGETKVKGPLVISSWKERHFLTWSCRNSCSWFDGSDSSLFTANLAASENEVCLSAWVSHLPFLKLKLGQATWLGIAKRWVSNGNLAMEEIWHS